MRNRTIPQKKYWVVEEKDVNDEVIAGRTSINETDRENNNECLCTYTSFNNIHDITPVIVEGKDRGIPVPNMTYTHI